MNEQELYLKQKIEKREKFDTILAYILIVVLLGALFFMLYLKFIRKDEVKDPIEYVPNYISVSDISNSLNSSELVSNYINNGATFSSSVANDNLVINYISDNNRIDITAKRVGNELEMSVTEDNSIVANDLYKEIASIVCVYYGTADSDCRSIVNNIDENSSVDGIRFNKISDTNTKVYIDITKGLFVNNNSNIYSVPTNVSINETNYVVNMLDTEINNISVVNDVNNIKVSGNITRLTDNRSNVTVMVKLYDVSGSELISNNQIFDENNFLGENGVFVISFVNDGSIDFTNVTGYSIEIIK